LTSLNQSDLYPSHSASALVLFVYFRGVVGSKITLDKTGPVWQKKAWSPDRIRRSCAVCVENNPFNQLDHEDLSAGVGPW